MLIKRETSLALSLNPTKDDTMNYENRDMFGMYKKEVEYGPGPRLMGADTLIGDAVYNLQDEHLGDIKEIMLDVAQGKIAYAVMSMGGVFTIGEKLFAVPWKALSLDTVNKRFKMDIVKTRFENAPGFNSDHWPNMANQEWSDNVQSYYHPNVL
jgi:sporulation protein YlmC with PRC-barrel domain